jgi:hypothetical protein
MDVILHLTRILSSKRRRRPKEDSQTADVVHSVWAGEVALEDVSKAQRINVRPPLFDFVSTTRSAVSCQWAERVDELPEHTGEVNGCPIPNCSILQRSSKQGHGRLDRARSTDKRIEFREATEASY